jgi:hypothetical protein
VSAETLRRAAALMRERARGASEGPWRHEHVGLQGGEQINNGAVRVARVYANEDDWRACENAAHVASWHPAVALAVADWLDSEDTHQFGPTEHAINVARAYLGESA